VITYTRECTLIAGAILALAADGDEERESDLVESYLRITDKIFAEREGRSARQQIKRFVRSG
jgi:hypothetical protein